MNTFVLLWQEEFQQSHTQMPSQGVTEVPNNLPAGFNKMQHIMLRGFSIKKPFKKILKFDRGWQPDQHSSFDSEPADKEP